MSGFVPRGRSYRSGSAFIYGASPSAASARTAGANTHPEKYHQNALANFGFAPIRRGPVGHTWSLRGLTFRDGQYRKKSPRVGGPILMLENLSHSPCCGLFTSPKKGACRRLGEFVAAATSAYPSLGRRHTFLQALYTISGRSAHPLTGPRVLPCRREGRR